MVADLNSNSANWIFALITSVSFSFVGTLIPNLYKETKSPRAHNWAKLLNEFLARHQLTYLTFFAAIALTAEFDTAHVWIKKLFAVAIGIVIVTYVAGVYNTIHQDAIFFRAHNCSYAECDQRLGLGGAIKLYWFNALSAIGLFLMSLWVAMQVK